MAKKTLIAVMMNDLDLNHSAVNHMVYFRHSGDEHTIIVVATDNMAVTLKWLSDVIKFKSEIKQ